MGRVATSVVLPSDEELEAVEGRQSRVRDQLAGSERVLLEATRELRYEDFRIVCQR